MSSSHPSLAPPTSLVQPARIRLVTPPWAARVVSPLHDVLTESERRAMLAANPDSYLHVTADAAAGSRAADDEPDLAAPARALHRLLEQGAYREILEPSLFVYRMREGVGVHTGVVGTVDLAGFADGRVLGHERVQPARVEGLLRHYERVPMRSELVALFHRPDPGVAELTARVCRRPPLLEFTDSSGIEQAVWQVPQAESVALAGLLGSHRHYIADGHHRVAAALREWERGGRREDGATLCVLYPEDQIVLHAFHRRVRGPVEVPALLRALTSDFDVRTVAGPHRARGTLGMYAGGRWHLLTPLPQDRPPGVAGLDVTVLDSRVLRPHLRAEEGDPRLEFVPGLRALEPTIQACDDDGGVLFTLHAPRLRDLTAVAERHEVMSPKTTYVAPKPRTGVFLR